ncbi:MAG TPA: DUF6114 domain-containing protein [Trebonia sp.]|jgi:hypothetical protein|nr:DUF6114 domain-containing protein [Trebonia sp.]
MTADDAGSNPEAQAGSPSTPMESASPPQSPSTFARGWRAFRRWRRSRPFWGGLLLILGGVEMLALPLSGVLIKGAIKFVIYIGIGGVFGVLIGALLITAGLVIWFNPTHRVFYGVAGIVLGLLSFPASNLGGFLLGMLLAIFGGAAAIAWTPLNAAPAPPAEPLPPVSAGPLAAPSAGALPAAGEGLRELGFAGEQEPGSTPAPPGSVPAPRRDGDGHNGASSHRFLAITAMPALILAGMLTHGTARTAPASTFCILGVICLPTPGSGSGTSSPSPAASASPSPSASATPDTPADHPAGASASPSTSATPGSPSASPSATPSGSAAGNPKSDPSTAPGTGKTTKKAKSSKKVAVKNVAAPSGLEASSATSVLTAGAATLDDFQFVGVVNLPVAGGGTEQTLEFTASSASLTGNVNVAVTQNWITSNTSSPDLDFSDDMTLYSTKLCGDIYGITGQVCFTPSTIDQVLLRVASVLTGVVPISMTDVTTDQPVTTAGGLQIGSLTLG